MKYAFHFEFCERPELPEWLRADVFRALAFVQGSFGLESVLERVVPPLLSEAKAARVIELGAGSGDGLARVARAAAGAGLECIATDKFPQLELWREKLGAVRGAGFREQPVSFDDFDRVLSRQELEGAALLLTAAFHHVPAREARDFLERAARLRAHVVVVEPLPRSITGLVLGLGAGLAAFAFPLVSLVSGRGLRAPFSWLRQVLDHWVLPIVPFVLGHDGAVSALRQRTLEEWRDLTRDLPYDLKLADKLGLFGNFSALLLRHREEPVSPGLGSV